MAIGDVAVKKMYQGLLGITVAAKYTCPTNKQAQITEIWFFNQNTTTTRTVTIYVHGTAETNRVFKIQILPDKPYNISQVRIVLEAGEVLAFKQDVGTDVIATIYGVEEVIA